MGRAVVSSVNDLAAWVIHFRSISATGTALELLSGAQAAALETVAYVYCGLGRAAVTAIRLQMELVLGYTYFKDHVAEWEKVKRTGDGYMLFSAVENYHREMDRTLPSRLTMIDQRCPPTLKRLHRILSAHVHGQSPYTLPSIGPLESMALSSELMRSVVEMQRQSMDALTSFLVAVYANKWPQLPQQFVSRVSRALTPKQRPQFFSEGA